MKIDQTALALSDEKQPKAEWLQLEKVIRDRGSKYSITAGKVTNNDELKAFLKRVKAHKKYAKATHNSYAARVMRGSQIFDVKNDDGETGAGMVILRQLRKEYAVNLVVVVTRWYGGVKLHADRFKHVQDGTRLILQEIL